MERVRWPGATSREIEESLATIEQRVERMIAERRRAGPTRTDLLSRLLAAHDEHGGSMSDRQLRDEIVTLFIAGHETTATTLAWSFYLLGRHPEANALARAEARALAGRRLGADDLPRLGACLQVFKEALRLYPSIYLFVREAVADVGIGEVDLPRGTMVLISPWALHHRPDVWPDPERFDPRRFDPEAERSRPPLSYLPFSAGPRTCIGNHFAMLEGPLVLATLLGRVDSRARRRGPHRPGDLHDAAAEGRRADADLRGQSRLRRLKGAPVKTPRCPARAPPAGRGGGPRAGSRRACRPRAR